MAQKRIEKIRKRLSNTPSLVFLQFFLILLVVISLILFTSVSFYQSIIENVTAYNLQDSVIEIEKLDTSSDRISGQISEIERKNFVIVEIYEKENENDNSFSKPVYTQYLSSSFREGEQDIQHKTRRINFKYDEFFKNELRSYNETTQSGRYINPDNYEYYLMTSVSDDGNTLYVVAVRASQIDSQASAVSVAVIFILGITFILISIIAYLFITRITKPLHDIRDVTMAMAETNDVTLRIPTHKRSIITETDETISSVNYLYESLILAQESLKEKTEFLAAQLKERDSEQKSREEFIASTSHELKTPIAIIQGYAEGAMFLANDPKALNEYCETIIDECGRMTNLVLNMMSLSNLKQTKVLNYRDFSIRDFVAERLNLLKKTFEKHGISVENLITDDIYGSGDPEKLHFVVNNLLSNAISYIGGERKIIRARYEDMELVYRIFIFNSGEHIPQTELEKLWEAFYRNDPARNRTEGHFGLGLSIVKSVQDSHSQACGVDNAEGGVEFWFDILK